MWSFSNEVCLAACEAMLCIVKLLRSEVSAEVGGTLHFTLFQRNKTSLCCRHNFTWRSQTSLNVDKENLYICCETGGVIMSESKLRTQSMDFAVQMIGLVKALKGKRESIISNQIGRSGTSIGANIRRRSMHMARQTLLRNSKLRSKKQMKPAIGLNCSTRQITSSERNKNHLTPPEQVFV